MEKKSYGTWLIFGALFLFLYFSFNGFQQNSLPNSMKSSLVAQWLDEDFRNPNGRSPRPDLHMPQQLVAKEKKTPAVLPTLSLTAVAQAPMRIVMDREGKTTPATTTKKKTKSTKKKRNLMVAKNAPKRPWSNTVISPYDNDDSFYSYMGAAPKKKDEAQNGKSTEDETSDADKALKKTKQEWIKLLVEKPSRTSLQLFLQAYQQNKVDRKTFYEVLDLMANQPEARKYSILALNETPSVSSYQRIVLLSQASLTPEETLLVQQSLKRYSSIETLSFVQQSLTSENPVVRSAALVSIQQTAQTALTPSNSTGRDSRSNTPLAKYGPQFYTILQSLETLMAKETNESVRSNFQQTIALLQKLGLNSQVAQNYFR